MKTTCFAMGMLLLLASAAWSDEAVTIRFPSVRPGSATIAADGDFYTISVTLRPVGCFDAALNRSISFRKAENMAMTGLAKYLLPEKKDRRAISCSGLEVTHRAWTSESCELTCRVPRSGVKIVEKSESPKDVTSRAPARFEGSLLTRETDYRETLDLLSRDLESMLPPAPASSEQLEEFYFALSDVEAKMTDALDQLKSQLEKDLKLLTMERGPLLASLETVRKDLAGQLKARAESAEWLESCAEIELNPDFAAAAIVSQPFLIQQGGCKIFEFDGKWYLLAVAAAIVDPNLKPGVGQMKARKIAQVRCQKELAAEKEDVRIEVREILEEKVVVENRNGIETTAERSDYSQTIETRVTAVIENVQPAGWWMILDETSGESTVYVVLGSCLEK